MNIDFISLSIYERVRIIQNIETFIRVEIRTDRGYADPTANSKKTNGKQKRPNRVVTVFFFRMTGARRRRETPA